MRLLGPGRPSKTLIIQARSSPRRSCHSRPKKVNFNLPNADPSSSTEHPSRPLQPYAVVRNCTRTTRASRDRLPALTELTSPQTNWSVRVMTLQSACSEMQDSRQKKSPAAARPISTFSLGNFALLRLTYGPKQGCPPSTSRTRQDFRKAMS